MTISTEDREFFATLGERIASLRKANNVTQVQLAEALGVSQQTLQSYEVGRRRIPVSALPVVASTLSVSLDKLFGSGHRATRSKRGPVPQWQQQMEAVAQLPKARQRFVSEMLQTVLAQAASR
ncbi:MAG: helix-turn-helix domain-containing protein [Burkholderiales bacterium]|jgi:transcriptional regulator with XRE-family HTH domain|nr:helix-turn-helix domain-containing protein [Burkholderiales bacterium]